MLFKAEYTKIKGIYAFMIASMASNRYRAEILVRGGNQEISTVRRKTEKDSLQIMTRL